jgi:hypothetical protein
MHTLHYEIYCESDPIHVCIMDNADRLWPENAENPLNYYLSHFTDDRQEQQDAPAAKLPSEDSFAGLENVYWHIQSVRQTHEPDPWRLRGIQENQTEKLEAART